MLAMVKVAVRRVLLVGCTCTLMVWVLPRVIVSGKLGALTRVKSLAWAPLKLRLLTRKAPVPALRRTNVLRCVAIAATGPKSVPSPNCGVVSPLAMVCPLPSKLSWGVGALVSP